MKKFITGIAIAGFVLLGINSVTAQSLSQDGDRPEVIAKAKVSQISEALALNDNQERALFRAYVQKEVKYKKGIAGKDLKNDATKAEIKKYDDELAAAVKKILSAEQYKKWQALKN